MFACVIVSSCHQYPQLHMTLNCGAPLHNDHCNLNLLYHHALHHCSSPYATIACTSELSSSPSLSLSALRPPHSERVVSNMQPEHRACRPRYTAQPTAHMAQLSHRGRITLLQPNDLHRHPFCEDYVLHVDHTWFVGVQHMAHRVMR